MLSAFLLVIRMLCIYQTLNHITIPPQYTTIPPQYISVPPQYISVPLHPTAMTTLYTWSRLHVGSIESSFNQCVLHNIVSNQFCYNCFFKHKNRVNTNFTFYKFINKIIKAFTHLRKKFF